MAINIPSESFEGSSELTGEQIDAANQILQQSVGTDINGGLQILGYLGLGINVLYILVFLGSAIGLYKLSKKLGDDHSWLAFIPLLQLYTYFKTAGYGFWKGLLILVLCSLLGGILGSVLMGVVTQLVLSMVGSDNISAILIVSFLMGIFLGLFVMMVATFFLYSGMAQRAGQSSGTAILMTLFPWCMMWIVANRVPEGVKSSHTASSGIEQTTVSNSEL